MSPELLLLDEESQVPPIDKTVTQRYEHQAAGIGVVAHPFIGFIFVQLICIPSHILWAGTISFLAHCSVSVSQLPVKYGFLRIDEINREKL